MNLTKILTKSGARTSTLTSKFRWYVPKTKSSHYVLLAPFGYQSMVVLQQWLQHSDGGGEWVDVPVEFEE